MYMIFVDYIGGCWEARHHGCDGVTWRRSSYDRDVAINQVVAIIGVKRSKCRIVDHSGR